LFLYYTPGRRLGREWREQHEATKTEIKRSGNWSDSIIDVLGGDFGFTPFVRWFRQREDIENEGKIARQDFTFEDPQLRCVRASVTAMLPDYTGLRVQREPLHLVIKKKMIELPLDSLSHGEKAIIVLAADIASRLAMAYPNQPNALEAEAIIAIDEIDQHLHPAWQRVIAERLQATFPNCQFIVTTHSPQILSAVPTESIVALRDFKVEGPSAPTFGRDSNAILTEVLGVSERPATQALQLEQISRLIDEDHYDDAKRELDHLAKQVTERDGEVVRLRSLLHFLSET
jgi:predicted ATP-binding protein involved in virulence